MSWLNKYKPYWGLRNRKLYSFNHSIRIFVIDNHEGFVCTPFRGPGGVK